MQVREEVPVPEAPKTGFLCQMLAAGGTHANNPFIVGTETHQLTLTASVVCHSDRNLLDDTQGRPGFNEEYILVRSPSTHIRRRC